VYETLARAAPALAITLGLTLSPGSMTRTAHAELPVTPVAPFAQVAQKATEALNAGRLDEALASYSAAVVQNPEWADGWWQIGLLHFDAGRFEQARSAVTRLVSLEPETGLAWVLLGLSEYRLGEYDAALTALSRGLGLGVPEGQPMSREAAHHLTLLLIRKGDYGEATKYLPRLVLVERDDPELVAACGLMALRKPLLPSEVPPGGRDLVMTAGRAARDAMAYRKEEARREFEDLVARYPTTRGVHYIYALFLSRDVSSEALPMLLKELDLYPDHAEAQLEVALQILERGQEPAAALPHAQAALRLAPRSPLAHLALGRSLVENGALAEGITRMEEALRLDPDSTDTCLALAQAYARAGRDEDVKRVKARLGELYAKRDPSARTGQAKP
jgi:tetratricopeptide (TPR) repeat protein